MKVILTRDVPNVGRDRDIVTVAGGYARNYLFPRQLALVATPAVLKQSARRTEREAGKSAGLLAAAKEAGAKIEGANLQILARSNPRTNRLFGAVTEADVADALKKATGVEVDKRKISLIDPIKATGEHTLTARLHPEVTSTFVVDVVTTEQLEAREKVRLAAEERARKEAEAAAAQAEPVAVA